MDEFIESIVEKLGLPEGVAKAATSKVLAYLKDNLQSGEFAELIGKIPGAESLLAAQSASADSGSEASGGGFLGGLTKAAGGMLGGEAGEGLELAGALGDAGLSPEQAPEFFQQIIAMIQKYAGDDWRQKIASQAPALKPFLT